jgi:negative regulator of replication initiation
MLAGEPRPPSEFADKLSARHITEQNSLAVAVRVLSSDVRVIFRQRESRLLNTGTQHRPLPGVVRDLDWRRQQSVLSTYEPR